MKPLAALLLLFPFFCTAQSKEGQARLDSLLAALPYLPEDTNRVNLLHAISFDYYRINPDEGLRYAGQALRLSQKISWQLGIAKAHHTLAINSINKADYPTGMQHAFTCLRIAEELGDKRFIYKACGILGVSLPENSFSEAQAYNFRALKIAEELGDKKGMVRILNNIGLRYGNQERYHEAMKCYQKSFRIAEELNDKDGIIFTTSNIGGIYAEHKEYVRALSYEYKSLGIAHEIGDKRNVALCLGYIGKIYLAIVKDSSYIRPDSLMQAGNSVILSRSADYLKEALARSMEISLNDAVSDMSGKLWEAYLLQGNYKGAFEAYRLHTMLQDSLFNQENKERMARIEAQRVMEVKQKDILIAQLEVAKKRNERAYFIGGITLLLISASIVIRNIQRKRLQEKQAAQLKTMIDTQESERKRISRDLHDDIGTKLSALGLFLSSMKEKASENSNLEIFSLAQSSEQFIKEAVRDLRQLLMDLSPSVLEDFGYTTAVEGLVKKINETRLIHFNLIIFGMKGRLHKDYELALYRITQELINNVLKHASAKNVTLQIGRREDVIVLMIEDDGKGFELSQHAEGYGLKNLAARTALMSGVLTIDTAPGRGTSVLIEIPFKNSTSHERIPKAHAFADS